MKQLKVAVVQQSCTQNRDENIAKAVSGIREGAKKGADLVVLQELHNGVYFPQSEDDQFFELAESIPGPSTELFGKLAKELGVVLTVSLFEKRAPGLYHNTAVVLEKDGTMVGKYRKTATNRIGVRGAAIRTWISTRWWHWAITTGRCKPSSVR